MLTATLAAGLWPFYVPVNQVSWVENRDGLAFGRHGSAVTSEPIAAGERADATGTIEIWLEAANVASNSTILSFDRSAHPGEPLSVHQQGDGLSIRRNNVDDHGVSRTAVFYVARLFKKNTPVFLSVAFDGRYTSIYVNGTPTAVFPLSGAWNDLTGRLLVANSPAASDSWSGKIFGLAIYYQELTAAEVVENYLNWEATGRPTLASIGRAAAVYRFDEHHGRVAHNTLDSVTSLTIPKRYFVLHPHFLRAPWKEFRPAARGYWSDVVINIAGFVPFGFYVCAYLTSIRGVKYPRLATIILGLFTSLLIEILQAFLPTRSSGATDLITNTLGSTIGAVLWSHCMECALIFRTKMVGRRSNVDAVKPVKAR